MCGAVVNQDQWELQLRHLLSRWHMLQVTARSQSLINWKISNRRHASGSCNPGEETSQTHTHIVRYAKFLALVLDHIHYIPCINNSIDGASILQHLRCCFKKTRRLRKSLNSSAFFQSEMFKLTIKVTSDEMTNVKVMKFQRVTKPNDKLKNDKKKRRSWKLKRKWRNLDQKSKTQILIPISHLPTSWAVQPFNTPSSAWNHVSWLWVEVAGWTYLEIAGETKNKQLLTSSFWQLKPPDFHVNERIK